MKICIFLKICDFPERSDGTVSIVMLEHISLFLLSIIIIIIIFCMDRW